jgi:glycosyltransferase involved in cell wall biosynthesis
MQIINKEIPLVTIGIPTYQRPELLRRALHSVVQQSYQNHEIIVSDNDSSENNIENIISDFRKINPRITYIKHKPTLGAINNFFYCLEKADGDFFMWLADDDEITDNNYIQELVNIHIANSNVATAFANWKLMSTPENGKIIPMRDYKSKYWFLRTLKFTWFAIDDFFYGLHRTNMLKNATKLNYWNPNKTVLSNWAYPFLLDMVIQGKIIGTTKKNIQWINHDYTSKSYAEKNRKSKIKKLLKLLLRRINVHYLYATKIAQKKSLISLPLLILVSISSLTKELSIITIKMFLEKFKS